MRAPRKVGRGGVTADQSIGTRLARASASVSRFSLARAPGPLAPDRLVLVADPGHERVAPIGLDERAGDADRPRRVDDVDDRARVGRRDLDRGVGPRRRRAADEQRDREALALHLGRDVGHLVERRGDQPRQADQVGVDLDRLLEDARGRDHHAEVDDLVVVAAEHDPDDVLADVVDVALDRRGDDRAGSTAGAFALRLEIRDQDGDGLLHHPGALDDLRQEHPAGPEQVADDVHAGHERTLDDVERPRRGETRLLGVLDDVGVDAGDERVGQPLVDGSLAPGEVLRGAFHPGAPGVLRGQVEQPLGRVGPAVQDDVLDPLAELGLDLVVDRQDAGVDDGHVEAGRDRVIEEDRMDRLADPVVAAERERDVGHAARCPRPGELDLQPLDGLDERDGVGVVLLHPGRDGEDVGVEDDVLGL